MSTPLRVVQWATGNIGTRSLRAVIEHPDLELVGLYVHAADKVGKDAGELCGAEPTGVLATASIDDVLALGADCVLYMPQGCDVDDVCRILAVGHEHRDDPRRVRTGRRAWTRRRASGSRPPVREGGTSIHATGSSPGFISEALPIVLLTMQRRLDRLQIDEFADMSSRNSPELLFDLMAFGGDPAAVRRPALRSPGPCLRPVAVGRSPTPSGCRSTPSSPAARSPWPPTTSRSPPAP